METPSLCHNFYALHFVFSEPNPMNKVFFGMIALIGVGLFNGCTRYDPYTGQQQIDPGATAGVAGLALGAAALGVAASNNHRNDVYVVNPRPYYRPYYRPVPPPPVYRGGYGAGYRHGYRNGYYRR